MSLYCKIFKYACLLNFQFTTIMNSVLLFSVFLLVHNQCTSIDGTAAVLIETSDLHKINTVFIQPFLKGIVLHRVPSS